MLKIILTFLVTINFIDNRNSFGLYIETVSTPDSNQYITHDFKQKNKCFEIK